MWARHGILLSPWAARLVSRRMLTGGLDFVAEVGKAGSGTMLPNEAVVCCTIPAVLSDGIGPMSMPSSMAAPGPLWPARPRRTRGERDDVAALVGSCMLLLLQTELSTEPPMNAGRPLLDAIVLRCRSQGGHLQRQWVTHALHKCMHACNCELPTAVWIGGSRWGVTALSRYVCRCSNGQARRQQRSQNTQSHVFESGRNKNGRLLGEGRRMARRGSFELSELGLRWCAGSSRQDR